MLYMIHCLGCVSGFKIILQPSSKDRCVKRTGKNNMAMISPRFLCCPTAFFSTCWSRGTSESSMYTQNSGFAHATLPWHISTFRDYRILFSIRNTSPIIFLFIHNHLTFRKWCYNVHSITTRFYLRPSHFVISLSFSNICHVTSRKLRLPQCIMGHRVLKLSRLASVSKLPVPFLTSL